MLSFLKFGRSIVDVKKERQNVANLAMGIASITLFTIVAQVVLTVILLIVAPQINYTTTVQLILNAVTMYGIGMPLSMVFFSRCDIMPAEKKNPKFLTVVALIPICFLLTYVGSVLGTMVESLVASLMGRSAYNPVESAVSSVPLWAVFLFFVVLAPIFEEIFYRRVVINRLRRYGDLPAILVSGILFGVIHGNLSQFFYAAMLGILLGAVYVHTGKLRYTISLHMMINFMGSFYTMLMQQKFGGEIPTEFTDAVAEAFPTGYRMMVAYSNLYTISFLLGIPAMIYFIQQLRLKKGAVTLNGKNSFRVVLLNWGVWMSALILLAYFAFGLIYG